MEILHTHTAYIGRHFLIHMTVVEFDTQRKFHGMNVAPVRRLHWLYWLKTRCQCHCLKSKTWIMPHKQYGNMPCFYSDGVVFK